MKLRHPLFHLALAASLLLGLASCNVLRSGNSANSTPASPAGAAASPTTQAASRQALAASSTAPASQPAVSTADEQELRNIVTYLASDSLEGRGINTAGLEKAAQYIRNKFVAAGLHPFPGHQSFFWDFDYTTVAGIADNTSLRAGDQPPYQRARDYTVVSSSAEGPFSGPLVFAGYGISSKDAKYDDFDGIDAKGKICLVMRFEPHDAKGNSRFSKEGWSPAARLRSKFNACASHGALAVILVNPANFHNGDYLLPFASSFQEGPASVPVLQVTRKLADELLKAGGQPDLATLQKKIDSTGHPASVPLQGVTLSGDVGLQRTVHKLHNVVAYLPGAGPDRDQYIVVGAHYDHLGFGGPGSLYVGPRAIHHGADDNASGSAAVIDLAERLSPSPYARRPGTPTPPRPDRSILFVCFTAEESGLIGSTEFLKHPPVPLSDIAAMLNLDMVGRVRNQTLYIGGAGTAAPFDAFVKQADADSPLQFKDFGRGGLGPSDHMSFAVKKIPVLFLFSGMHADYHRPSDTADKINYQGLSEVVSVAEELALDMASMPASPYLAAADASTPRSLSSTSGSGTGSHVSLGVIPDYGTDISKGGVRIIGTSPNSPAHKAGLKDGDVIVGFGSKKIDNLYDLTDALAAGKAGEKVTIKILRGGKPMALEATLVERGG